MKLDTNGWPMTSDTNRRIMPGDHLWRVGHGLLCQVSIYGISQPDAISQKPQYLYVGDAGNPDLYDERAAAVSAFESLLEASK